MPPDDIALLREYAATRSDRAFAELVSRHLPLVYSSALRQVGDPHLAEEVTQAVFIVLARKAASLDSRIILGGWLHRTTRHVAANALQAEFRRRRRETEALKEASMQKESCESVWREMLPVLDEALSCLRPVDRDALVLRYFENRTLQEVATALGLHERAAQKRIARGLEKLRNLLLKRGLAASSQAIAGAVAAHSVQAAPAGLEALVATSMKGTAAPFRLALANEALKAMTWAKIKLSLALSAAALVVLVAGVAESGLFGLGKTSARSAALVLSGDSAPPERGTPRNYRGYAQVLVPYNPGKLHSIELPIQRVNSGPLNFFIAEDRQGVPGNVLELFPNVLPPRIGETNALVLQSTVQPTLRLGVKYWLCAEPASPETLALWFYSTDLPPAGYAVEQAPSKWVWIDQSQVVSNKPALSRYPNRIRIDKAYLSQVVVTR